MAERVVERTLSDGGLSIHYRLERLGGDLLLTVTGGAAHVGCVVLATHRQSLTGSGADSADSSVLNRSGHKDEFLLRALAERLSAVAGCAVAAVGGVIGVLAGIGLSKLCSIFTNVALSVPAMIIAFSFSAVIGVAFGYFPAKKAAALNPIDALRYD